MAPSRIRQADPVRLLLLDSASLYWRAYHALPDSIVDREGQPVNAVRGFLDTIGRLMSERHPDLVVACWDDDWRPAWRVALVPSYKTHRVEDALDASSDEEVVPDTLGPQIPVILELLDALGIGVVGAPDCEADDVIATLALRHSSRGDHVDIASGDRDLVQLVDDRVRLLYTGGTSASRGGAPWVEYDPMGVVEAYSVTPAQYPLMAALRGDPSDGLPGLPGIGAKTAVALVNAFGDLDALLSAARATPVRPMTPRLADILTEGEDVLRACLSVTALEQRPGVVEVGQMGSVDRDRVHGLAEHYNVERAVSRILEHHQGADE